MAVYPHLTGSVIFRRQISLCTGYFDGSLSTFDWFCDISEGDIFMYGIFIITAQLVYIAINLFHCIWTLNFVPF